ncbi:MAG: methyltransferase domain-containing protein [Halovenus sp.]
MTDTDATESFYNRWARLYDHVATASGVQSWRERAAKTLALSPGDTVVDLGCGTGANFPHLQERVGRDGRVVGIDIVPGMLAGARERIRREGWTSVHAVRGDATRPPVPEVDGLLSTFLVGMLPNPETAVRTWIQCVAPGGRVTLLNAVRSDRRLAAPLNLAFRGFVRATAPGSRLRRRSPAKTLEARWDAAREALFEGTVDQIDCRLAGGFVVLASGRVPEHGVASPKRR